MKTLQKCFLKDSKKALTNRNFEVFLMFSKILLKRRFSIYFVVFDITIVFSVQKLVRGKVLNVPLAVFKHICQLAGRF